MRKTTLVFAGFPLLAVLHLPVAAEPAPDKAAGPAPEAKGDAAPPESPARREPSGGRDEGDRGARGGWSERLLESYRDRLELTPEQAGKIREFLAESRKKRDEAHDAEEARIREVLTDAQRTKLEELRRSRGRGFGERASGERGGSESAPSSGRSSPFGGRWIGSLMEDIQRDLNLTAEQREKVDGIVQGAIEAGRARFEEMARGGFQNLDRQALRTEMEKLFDETSEKVKATLAPEQQEKYAKRLEDRRRVFQGFFRRGDERPSPQERVTRALDALHVEDPEENKAVKALLEHVAKLQDEASEFDRTSRDKARDLLKADGINDEAIGQRVDEIRKSRRAAEDRLRDAENELRQVTTARQELTLIQLGLLR